MHVIDLTHLMESGMPVFPGSDPAKLIKVSDIDSAGYNEVHIHLSAHTGTHIDCPKHIIHGGFDTGTAAADRFYGKGLVIDCRKIKPGEIISKNYLQFFENKIKLAEFIIFHSGWSRYWGTSGYFAGFPVPDKEAARYLTGFSLKGVGIDAISFDPVNSHALPVHKVLLSKGIVLIENLTNVESLPEEGFTFCCFPLKIKDGDGSPVRAVGLAGSMF